MSSNSVMAAGLARLPRNAPVATPWQWSSQRVADLALPAGEQAPPLFRLPESRGIDVEGGDLREPRGLGPDGRRSVGGNDEVARAVGEFLRGAGQRPVVEAPCFVGMRPAGHDGHAAQCDAGALAGNRDIYREARELLGDEFVDERHADGNLAARHRRSLRGAGLRVAD